MIVIFLVNCVSYSYSDHNFAVKLTEPYLTAIKLEGNWQFHLIITS